MPVASNYVGKSSDISEDPFRENEIKTNRIVSTACAFMGIALMVVAIGDDLDMAFDGDLVLKAHIFFCGLAAVIIKIVVKSLQYSPSWIKSALFAGIILMSTVNFFFNPLSNNFLAYGPVVCSAMYYDRRFIKRICLFSWISFISCLWLNVILETFDPYMQNYHFEQQADLWDTPFEVLVKYVIPHSIAFLLVYLICDTIAKRGRMLVDRQSAITGRISSMETELRAASDIQVASLPPTHYDPEDGLVRINAVMKPAKTVGGDFYDYFMSESDLVFLVADVSDKGMPAAMFMMKAKNAIRAAVLNDQLSLAETVTRANRDLCQGNSENMFVTLWIGRINTRTGVGKYVNCGHNPPIIRHCDGSTEEIENEPDMPLGLFEDAVPSAHHLYLKPSDTLFVFTDGFTDALNRNGDSFGKEQLMSAIRSISSEEQDPCALLADKVAAYSKGTVQFDDMTALSLFIGNTDSPLEKTVRVKAHSQFAGTVTEAINSILDTNECPVTDRRNIDAAFDDICENISDCAFHGKDGYFDFSLVSGENYIYAVITDDGAAYHLLSGCNLAKGEFSLEESNIPISQIVSQTMDYVEYSRKDDRNAIRLLKIWRHQIKNS